MVEGREPLEIVNETLLEGMKFVGELFGSGQMQLPFVLQSAEVMKTSVAHLEPHMDRVEGQDGKGRIVLATVKGDVHDIGNLVDMILSNNGYSVVNLGIKQPVTAILDAAKEHAVDVIGMSGLLVKSTVVMKENLLEMNSRRIASQLPVILGGAALTRAYVEQDLGEIFHGDVRYARDAFEGLRLMDSLMAVKRGEVPAEQLAADREKEAERKARHGRSRAIAARRCEAEAAEPVVLGRSDVAPDNVVPRPPFWGARVSKGIALAEYAAWLDERALFLGQWGLRGSRSGDGPIYDELVETEGRPRLRSLLAQIQTDGIVQAAVVHGYFPAVSKDEDLIILDPDSGYERCRFTFPRQRRDRRLCLADFFRSQEGAEPDVVAFQVVTMGAHVSQVTGELFARNAYREYLELHGLSVQLTEALAELWHARIRAELGFGHEDDPDLHRMLTKRAYRGSRYSFGYPACPAVEDQERCRTCWSGSASASTCRRSRCWCPSSRRRRWSCTTRR